MNVYLYGILFLLGLSSVNNIAMEEVASKGKKTDGRLLSWLHLKKGKNIEGKDGKKNPQSLQEAEKLAIAIRIAQRQENKEGK